MRIGVFGGSFDPPHAAHAAAAKTAQTLAALDRVIWIPTFEPPHKGEPSASFVHRLAMVRNLIARDSGWEVSDLEATLPRPSYTLHTLRALKTTFGKGHSWNLILGADAWALFPKWHEPQAVLEEADLILISRQGLPLRDVPTRAVVLEGLEWPEESRWFREQLALNPSKALGQLPGPVAAYIRSQGLYGTIAEANKP